MSRVTRLVIGPVAVGILAATVVASAEPAGAQERYGQEFKKDKSFFKGKGFPKEKGFQDERDRDAAPQTDRREPADALRRLEAELDRMRRMQAEMQEQLRDLRESMRGGERGREAGRGPGDRGPMGDAGPRGPMREGGPRGGAMGGGMMMRGGAMGGGGMGGFGPGGMMGGAGPGFGPAAFERMSPAQLKQLISQLQRVLEEKTRGDRGDVESRKTGARSEKSQRAIPQDDVKKRIEQLSKELEELRRSIKK
ncbi:MAG TPA: hypothetical protein VLM40_06990 [Gemmata sp.]|nr:hypothetical protein [Gemmata sp.]